jgi:hypothetical protein
VVVETEPDEHGVTHRLLVPLGLFNGHPPSTGDRVSITITHRGPDATDEWRVQIIPPDKSDDSDDPPPLAARISDLLRPIADDEIRAGDLFRSFALA